MTIGNKEKPLAGIKVVEVATHVAAPICTRLMSEMGADVIKIEDTTIGDPWRYAGAAILGCPTNDQENPIFEMTSLYKKSISMNLKHPEALEALHKLIAEADVLVTSFRPNALEELGLDYETLSQKHPTLIYAQNTSYGEKGPDKDEPGFDTIAFWARSGFTLDCSYAEHRPMFNCNGYGDIGVGTALYGGVMTALFNRERTGLGEKVSVSLYGMGNWMAQLCTTATQEAYGNYPMPQTREMCHPLLCSYKCKDGEYVQFAVIEYDRLRPILSEVLELPEMMTDERLKDNMTFLKTGQVFLQTLMEAKIAEKTSDEWIIALKRADIPFGKLTHFSDVSKDPQALANNYMYPRTFASGNTALLTNSPYTYASWDNDYSDSVGHPILGEHTAEVLKSIGYTDEDVERFKEQKTIIARDRVK